MSKWSRKSVDANSEKNIVTGLITSDQFITEVHGMLQPHFFRTTYTQLISMWCIDYFKKYKRAPGQEIQELFSVYARSKNADEDQIELIEKYLSGLSKSYEEQTKFNLKYALDNAELYLRTRKIEIHRENINSLLVKNKIIEAEKEIAKFKQITRPSTTGIDILKDNVNKYLNEEEDVLFRFPGALGNLVGDFCREDFVSLAAPMKRGKTFWLIFMAMIGLFAGLKVVYYDFESGRSKMLRRFYQAMTGEPKKKQVVHFPFFDEDNYIESKKLKKKGLTAGMINKKRKQVQGMVSEGRIQMINKPQYSMCVSDIRTDLDNLEYYHGFVPDVILVDYADILAPEKYSERREERHRINETWGSLRGLAQEKHCLVVTVSQTNKATFKKDIEQDDLAEDIRKMAHVTHMISLNQTNEDKKRGFMRVGTLALRDDEFFVDNEVIVLQCLPIGKPYLDSRFKKEVKNLENV